MKKTFILIVFIFITIFSVSAQKLSAISKNTAGSIIYADLNISKNTSSDDIFYNLLQINKYHKFVFLRTFTDNTGNIHDSYQQYYKGIKVEGGIYTLHSKEAVYYHISGNFEAITNLEINTVLTTDIALQKITKNIGAKEYAWENAEAEKLIKILRNDKTASYKPKAELLIVKNWDLFEKTGELKHHLCYAFNIKATQPESDLRVYIDAQAGEVVAKKNMLCQIDGTANTVYNGSNVPIKISLVANTTNQYRLYDDENNIRTLNAGNTTAAVGTEYTNSGKNWATAKYEHDAHYGATKTVTYWKTTHGRQSYNGNFNTLLTQLTNAPSPNFGNDNATWNQGDQVVRYGNGDVVFKPLTSLDIVAHEIGHAYSYGFGLDYASSTDIRDLHEGLSDIWASCIDRNNWTIGEQIMKNGTSCLRSIINPTLSTALAQGSTTYKSSIYNAIIDNAPHSRGLVLAHWFYILSEGKTGTNELGKSYSVVGISKEMAEQIVYGMYPYLNTTGWASVANAAKQSAKTRYGACSQQYISVVNALYAVGLETQMISIPTLQFTQGTAIICDNSTGSFSVQVSAPTSSYRWELPASLGVSFANGSNTIDTSTPNVNVNVNFAALGSNYISANYIPLKVSVPCPYDPNVRITQTYLFWAGKPQVPPIVPQTAQACLGQTYTVIADGGFAAEDYVWQTTTPTKLVLTNMSYYNAATFQVLGIGTGIIRVGVRNRCTNTFAYRDYSVNIRPCLEFSIANLKEANTPKYFLYPNPASSTVNISLEKIDNTLVSSEESTFTYKVYNSLGILLYENAKDANNLETSFSVSSRADGIYTVLIQTEKGTQALKLAVQKGKIAN
jgi:Zn-dependent metalloprotease